MFYWTSGKTNRQRCPFVRETIIWKHFKREIKTRNVGGGGQVSQQGIRSNKKKKEAIQHRRRSSGPTTAAALLNFLLYAVSLWGISDHHFSFLLLLDLTTFFTLLRLTPQFLYSSTQDHQLCGSLISLISLALNMTRDIFQAHFPRYVCKEFRLCVLHFEDKCSFFANFLTSIFDSRSLHGIFSILV